MADSIRLAIDAMGGDFGPPITVPAALAFLSEDLDASVTLVGDKTEIQQLIPPTFPFQNRLNVLHTEQVVAMGDKPSIAIRKTNSSLVRGLMLVADKQADGFVSAGNTGALMMLAMRKLGCLPTISRPAICTYLPTRIGNSYLLDMGANVQCSAKQLHQFGVMASCEVKLREGIERPRVGLLNIGTEEVKGTPEIQQAAELFDQDTRLNYVGYVEGDKLFDGSVDIIVCDGFSGNVALKSIEGLASMVATLLKQSFNKGVWPRLVGLLALPMVKKITRRINPERYNGASLLGLGGVVIKSHGGASVLAYQNALEVAALESRRKLPEMLASELSKYHS